MDSPQKNRLFVKVTRDNLPQVKDKYPFLYLERGRLEIDDSSIKWIDAEKNVVRLPVATLNTLILGPGTSITHEAIKVCAASNCCVCWTGEDSLIFYAAGHIPTSNTRNLRNQMMLACNEESCTEVAKRMYLKRFVDVDLDNKSIPEMMGMEGNRIKALYEEKAKQYNVGWKGRSFVPGQFDMSDMTNQILTSTNAALYGLLTSAVYSLGYSPHIGFIHSGSPLPFVYDLADLYKEHLCIDLAFALTLEMAGQYNKEKVASEFRTRVLEMDLMSQIGKDIAELLPDPPKVRTNARRPR